MCKMAHACCLATCGPIGASPYREKGSAIRVLSDIRDQYETLTNQGYRDIVGIRDVFPLPNADIPQIRADLVRVQSLTGTQSSRRLS